MAFLFPSTGNVLVDKYTGKIATYVFGRFLPHVKRMFSTTYEKRMFFNGCFTHGLHSEKHAFYGCFTDVSQKIKSKIILQ